MTETLIWLEAIAAEASALAITAARTDFFIEEKGAGDFVSAADREVETLLREGIRARFPDHAVVGEEFGGEISKSGPLWLIDPIDGTSNFVRGLPTWAISVGFRVDGRAALGAIALPALDLVLSAERGSGLRLNGARVQLSRRREVPLIALGENGFEPASDTDLRAHALRQEGYAVRRLGSAAFSLGCAALGKLDGYVERGCHWWDVAAAQVICAEAGLEVQVADLGEGFVEVDARWRSN